MVLSLTYPHLPSDDYLSPVLFSIKKKNCFEYCRIYVNRVGNNKGHLMVNDHHYNNRKIRKHARALLCLRIKEIIEIEGRKLSQSPTK